MERTVEWYAAIALAVVGMSHLTRPREWVEFFVRARAEGNAGIFRLALLHLLPGLLIAGAHPSWRWPGLVLTLLGLCWTVKGAVYLLFPAVGRWSISRVDPARAHEFRSAGAVLVVISGVLFYSAWQ